MPARRWSHGRRVRAITALAWGLLEVLLLRAAKRTTASVLGLR